MIKHIITNVTCVNEDASPAESFHAEIDEAFAKRILAWAALVKEQDIYCICKFDYRGTWSRVILDGEIDKLKPAAYEALIKDMMDDTLDDFDECNNVRVDVPMLHVVNGAFRWTAAPKHCGDDLEVRMPEIPLEFLTNDDELYFTVE